MSLSKKALFGVFSGRQWLCSLWVKKVAAGNCDYPLREVDMDPNDT